MALLQRARRCGRARVRDNAWRKENRRCYLHLLPWGAALWLQRKPRPSLPYCPASGLCGGPRLVVELHLWASMQDSGRLRPQSNSTMQAGTANVCILSICGVGALQADRLGVSRPQLQVQCRCQVRRHLSQTSNSHSRETNPCMIGELITIGTIAQMKLIELPSSSSRRSPLLKSSRKHPHAHIHQDQLFVSFPPAVTGGTSLLVSRHCSPASQDRYKLSSGLIGTPQGVDREFALDRSPVAFEVAPRRRPRICEEQVRSR